MNNPVGDPKILFDINPNVQVVARIRFPDHDMQTTDSAVLASAPAKENRALSANRQNTLTDRTTFTPAILELFAIFLLEQVQLTRI